MPITDEWVDYLFGEGDAPPPKKRKSTGTRKRRTPKAKTASVVRYLHLWTRSKHRSIGRVKAVVDSKGWTMLSPGDDAVLFTDNHRRRWMYYRHEQFGILYREIHPAYQAPGFRQQWCDCCQMGVEGEITYYDMNGPKAPVMRYSICKKCEDADVLRRGDFSASKEKDY